MALTDQQVFEKYKQLPKDLQKALFSTVTAEAIFRIGQKYNLKVDEDGKLAREIGFVLLGEKRARELPDSLQQSLGIAKDVALDVVKEVNHTIFAPIRESLKKIQGIPPTEALLPQEREKSPAAAATGEPPKPLDDRAYWETLREVKEIDSAAVPAESKPASEEKPAASPPTAPAPRPVASARDLSENKKTETPPPLTKSLEAEINAILPGAVKPAAAAQSLSPEAARGAAAESAGETAAGKMPSPAIPVTEIKEIKKEEPLPLPAKPAGVPETGEKIKNETTEKRPGIGAAVSPGSATPLAASGGGHLRDPYREPIEE